MHISTRLSQVPASPIRKLVPYAIAAKAKGRQVYHLNIGDPDIKTPQVMLDVLKNWTTNPIGYGQSQGDASYLESFLAYYHGLGATFLSLEHIQATAGGSEAIAMALFAVANPGDEILVFEPLYTNYNSYATVTGVTLVPVPTSIRDGFHLPDAQVIASKITKKTKAILYCNPNNPTGTVYRKDEIEMLVSLAKKHGLFLLSDEVYREYAFGGLTQTSLLSYMRKIPEQAIVLDSVSKRYSLCGVRLGALVSLNSEVLAGVLRIAQGRLSAGLVDQAIAAQMREVPASYLKSVNKEYEKRRDVLFEGLSKIPGVELPKPEGAFYAMVKLPVSNAEAFCQWLLTDFEDHNETVMLAPASGFYVTPNQGLDEVRIAYVLSEEKLVRAIELIKKALTRYTAIQKT